MTLADRVRLMRKKRGWIQKELSTRAGLSNSYVSMLERGGEIYGAVINNPKVETVEKLAQALGVRSEWLAFGIGPDPDFAPAEPKPRRRGAA